MQTVVNHLHIFAEICTTSYYLTKRTISLVSAGTELFSMSVILVIYRVDFLLPRHTAESRQQNLCRL